MLLLPLSAFSHQGSPQRIFNLQLLLSSASSSFTSTSAMSSFTTSINLLFGLPRFLFPSNSILSILLPIYPSSFLSTCPYHLSLASRVFSPNRPTCAVPLMYSFLILSILVHSCPFLSLRVLMKIVTSSTLPPPSPPPVFSSVPPSPTRTTLLVSLPPCTPSLSL